MLNCGRSIHLWLRSFSGHPHELPQEGVWGLPPKRPAQVWVKAPNRGPIGADNKSSVGPAPVPLPGLVRGVSSYLPLYIAAAPREFLPERAEKTGAVESQQSQDPLTAPDHHHVPAREFGRRLSIGGQGRNQSLTQ